METYTAKNLLALISRMPLKVFVHHDYLGSLKVEKGSMIAAVRASPELSYDVILDFPKMEITIERVLE